MLDIKGLSAYKLTLWLECFVCVLVILFWQMAAARGSILKTAMGEMHI